MAARKLQDVELVETSHCPVFMGALGTDRMDVGCTPVVAKFIKQIAFAATELLYLVRNNGEETRKSR